MRELSVIAMTLPLHSRQTTGGNFTKRQPRTTHKVSSPMSKEVQLARDSEGYRKASWHCHCHSRTDHIGPTAIDRSVQYPFRTWCGRSPAQRSLPAARVIAATRTLTALLPADIHLWADGSVSANGDGGAGGFAIFVQGTLRVTDVSQAGHGVFEFRAEAMACFAGLQAVLTLHDYNTCQGVRVLSDSKSLIQCLAQGPARQADTSCSSIWTVLAMIGSSNLVNVQWILGHVGLEGNTEVDLEAKRGTTLTQSTAPMDLNSACAAVKRHQQSVTDDRYLSDPHARIRRVLAGSVNQFQRWQHDWTRDQFVTVAQLRTAGRLPSPDQTPGLRSALMRRQNTWCYRAQLMTRPEGRLARRKIQYRSSTPMGLPRVVTWWRDVVGNVFWLKRSYSTPGPVSTAMGDCLRAGKPSRCEACQLGRLSLLLSVGR